MHRFAQTQYRIGAAQPPINPAVGMTLLFWGLRFWTGDSGTPTGALQIPPLRYAPVGMTKGRAAPPFRFDTADEEQQVPPLRFAPDRDDKGEGGASIQIR
jgi:hypothetical protein